MSTSMNRPRISLPEWQVRFLAERAKREGVSIAEVVRQLIEREAATAASARAESVWDIAGIAKDHGPLVQGLP